MSKLKKIFVIFLILLWINLTFANELQKHTDKTTINVNWHNVSVVMKWKNDVMDIYNNLIKDYSDQQNVSTKFFNWYFAHKWNNWKFDIWSYWQPVIIVWGWYKYIAPSFYMFTNKNNARLYIKTYVKWNNQNIDNAVWSWYWGKKPLYLSYIILSSDYKRVSDLNLYFRNYINNLSISDRQVLIDELENNTCISREIQTGKFIKICGLQKNPSKIPTDQTRNGYITINWYDNDTSFWNSEININAWINTFTIGFIRDLLDWFSGPDIYNNLNWIYITYWITQEGWYVFPSFAGDFDSNFINVTDTWLKYIADNNYNITVKELINKVAKASLLAWISIKDLVNQKYNNFSTNDLYKYWIWYLLLDKELTDTNNQNNFSYEINAYIPKSKIILADNFNTNTNASLVSTKIDHGCYLFWTKEKDNNNEEFYEFPNQKLPNSEVRIYWNCYNWNLQRRDDYIFWPLQLKTFKFPDTADNWKIFLHTKRDNNNYIIIFGSTFPFIFDKEKQPEWIHATVYIPWKNYILENKNEYINFTDLEQIINNSNKKAYIIANYNDILVSYPDWNLVNEVNSNFDNIDENFLKTLTLFIHQNISFLTNRSNEIVLDRTLIENIKLYTKEISDAIYWVFSYKDDNKNKALHFKIDKNLQKIYFINKQENVNFACNNNYNFNYRFNNINFNTKLFKWCNINENNFDIEETQVFQDFLYTITELYSTNTDKYLFDTTYFETDLTTFYWKTFNDVVQSNMLKRVSNQKENIIKNVLVLYNTNKDERVLDKIIYARLSEPKPWFVLLPYNKDTNNLIYETVNDYNVVFSDEIPVEPMYINYTNNIINYSDYDTDNFWFALNNQGNFTPEKNKDYYITTYLLTNFPYLKNMTVSVVGWNYIKWTVIECWNDTFSTNDFTFLYSYNDYLIENWQIKDCKIIVNVRADNDAELNLLKENWIQIVVYPESSDWTVIVWNPIKYEINNTTAVNIVDWVFIWLKEDWSDDLTKNLRTHMNWFAAHIFYNIPTDWKKVKYAKIRVSLTNNDFEFLPNPLVSRQFNSLISNLVWDTVIRNKTTYEIIIPYSNVSNSYEFDWNLSIPIQLSKNLTNVNTRTTDINLEIKYVYIDWTVKIINDEAKVTVEWATTLTKDYITSYVYNLYNKDDPVYATYFKQDWTRHDNYAVLEINYFHIWREVLSQRSNTRLPDNYQWDEDTIWAGVGRWRTYWHNLKLHWNFYDVNYFPPYNWSLQYWRSIEDIYNNNGARKRWKVRNNTSVVIRSTCRNYRTPLSSVSLDSDEWRWYWWAKEIIYEWEFYIHANEVLKENRVWQFMLPVILEKVQDWTYDETWNWNWTADFDVIFTDSINYYQKPSSSFSHEWKNDINKLKPRIILPNEFRWLVKKIKWFWLPRNIVDIWSTQWQIKHKFEKYPFRIEIYLKDTKELWRSDMINYVKNNPLYRIFDEWVNKKFLTLQIPSVVNGVYKWADFNMWNLWKTNNIDKKNKFIIEFTSQSQREVLVKMRIKYKKYIVSRYRKGYVYARNYTYRKCSKNGGCVCKTRSRWHYWVDRGTYDYLYWYSSYKQLQEVYNNYVVSAYWPSEKALLLWNSYIKWNPSNIIDYWEKISEIPTEYVFVPQTKLDKNKKISIVEYLLKNKDFPREDYKFFSNYNLYDKLIEQTPYESQDRWHIYYFKNASNLRIEKFWDAQKNTFEDDITIKYKWKKIFIIEWDLFLNTNLLPNNYNKDYVVFVVLWNVFVNSQVHYANWWVFVKWNYIILDWEKTFINHWPAVIKWYVLSYRTSTHIWPYILNYLNTISNSEEQTLRSMLKRSAVFMNDWRWINAKIFIKKIFTNKKLTE